MKTNIPSGTAALLIAGAYEEGRLIQAQSTKIDLDNSIHKVTLSEADASDNIKVFLLNFDALNPIVDVFKVP